MKTITITVCTIFAALLLAGCGMVSRGYVISKPDPTNPINKSEKFWVIQTQNETLDKRIVRHKTETVLKELGFNVVATLDESDYMLGFNMQDSQQSVTSVNTTSNILAMPSGNSGIAVVQSQSTPSTRTMGARTLSFSLGRTRDYVRYLDTKEIPPTIWEGSVGFNIRADKKYSEKALRELFLEMANPVSEYVTLGPRVW